MNAEIEQGFVRDYVDKKYRDRVAFELCSRKHRQRAISRFAHGSEKILSASVHKALLGSLRELNKKERELYVISCDDNDGTTVDFDKAIAYCEGAYTATVLIGSDFSVIKEETEGGTPKIVIIERKQ